MRTPIIYLAGNMENDWRKKVKERLPDFKFYDSVSKIETDMTEEQYTLWDLNCVRDCDIVLAYYAKNVKVMVGTFLEIGYAKALKKTILFVDEKSQYNEKISEHCGMPRACADIVFKTLEEAVDYLSIWPRPTYGIE